MLSWIEIDGEALRHNFRAFSGLLGKSRLAPVLKSDAYGHGMKAVFEQLASEKPEWLCTNYVSEATQLRAFGYKGRILVCGPYTKEMHDEAVAADAEVFLGHEEALADCLKRPSALKAQIEFDTGMSRQGFSPKVAAAIAGRLAPRKAQVLGICMHFSNVEDVLEHEYADHQMSQFAIARMAFSLAGFSVLAHAASSASSLILESSRFDLDRVGISLYGLWPSQATRLSYGNLNKSVLDLRQVMSWRTKVTSDLSVAAGQYIGYGCTYRANHNMSIAVIPVGYYEGYPRSVSGSPAYVLIKGQRCPIVGRICMNMMMVDVSHVPALAVGDVATLIGTDGTETIHAADVATWAGTIHYEIVTQIHPGIPRRILPVKAK